MILIAGATGELGQRVTKQLLAKDKPVRILVREGSEYQELENAGAEIVFGDLKNKESIEQACSSVDQLVSTASATMRGGSDTIESVDLHGTRSLIDAAQKAKVKQFVYVSAFGFTEDTPNALAQAKVKNENYLKGSGLNYTILQPVLFMESWIGFFLGSQLQNGPSVTLMGDGNIKMGFIAIQNVAELVSNVVDHPSAMNSIFPLNGPGSHSYRELVQMIEQATNQSIEINTVQIGEPIPGMPPMINELLSLMSSGDNLEPDTNETAQKFGVNLVSAREFIQQVFAKSD